MKLIPTIALQIKKNATMYSWRHHANKKIAAFCMLLLSALALPANAYTVDKAGTSISGLWWNQNESGWGAAITQRFDTMFITLYTYDTNGNPIWYVGPNCPVINDGCTSDVYKVAGGKPLTTAWSTTNSLSIIGTVRLVFSSVDAGVMSYTLNGVAGSKTIIRQIFGTAPPTSTGAFPITFNEIQMNSITFAPGVAGSCAATLTAKNISAFAVTPFLDFDVVVGNDIVTGQIIFGGNNIREGVTFQSTVTILSNSAFVACGAFTLKFNSGSSRTFR